MRSGRDRSTRGEDEGLDRWHHIVKAVDLTLDTCHGALSDGGHGVHIVLRGVGSEVATDGEELVLQPEEELLILLLELVGQQHADERIQLIDRAIALQTDVVLGHALPTDQGGAALVAALGI